MTLQKQVVARVNLRIARVAHLQPRRPAMEQSIGTLRELRDNALAIALAHCTEEIDAAPDNMLGAEHRHCSHRAAVGRAESTSARGAARSREACPSDHTMSKA